MTRTIELLFYFGLAFLLSHELDAVAHSEWRLLPLIGGLADDLAYIVFVVVHVPLIALLTWLAAHPSPRARRRWQMGIDVFLVLHMGLHWLFSTHEQYPFHSFLSEFLIVGAGVAGALHLSLLRHTRAANLG